MRNCSEQSFLIPNFSFHIPARYGGEGGIRTHGTVASSRALQARRFVHSRTSPARWNALKVGILSRDQVSGKATGQDEQARNAMQ